MIQTPLDKKTSKFETTTFVDLDFNFKTYSNLDVKTKLGENAIKQSIKNILMVDRYEKPFQPNFGAGLQDLLFENISPTNKRLGENVNNKANSFSQEFQF